MYSVRVLFDPTAEPENPIKWTISGRSLFFLFLQGTVYFLLLVVIEKFVEKKTVKNSRQTPVSAFSSAEDDDVQYVQECLLHHCSSAENVRILEFWNTGFKNKQFQKVNLEILTDTHERTV